tara:strand:+ start:106 stop:393 length:288 start_codon:yes stop_codon:yes gene_type:complete
MKRVNKHTRAGQQGKTIYCSKCNSKNKVYHFSWSALTCGGCNDMIDKYDFLLQPRQYRSNQGRSTQQYNSSMKVIKIFILILVSLATINLITKLI